MTSSRTSIVVLFGAPTVGKDTITELLVERTGRFQHFKKLKHGVGSRHGYTMITDAQLADLRATGRVVSEIQRYGSTYVVERTALERAMGRGVVSVIHSASVEETQLLHQLGAFVILLECSAATARERLERRDSSAVEARMAVFQCVDQRLDSLMPIAAGRLSSDEYTATELAAAIESIVLLAGMTEPT